MFGSDSRCSSAWSGFIGRSVRLRVGERRASPTDRRRRPSGRRRRRAPPRSCARSRRRRPAATASSAVYERASETVVSAQSTLRLRTAGDAAQQRVGVLEDLRLEILADVLPLAGDRGRGADVACPGAMTATCAAIVMNVPALAARAPAGPTQTITGTGALSSELDDLARGVEVATGRVELDDDRVVALAMRPWRCRRGCSRP